MKVVLPAACGDLQTSLLKLSIAANYRHGAFKSGDKHIKLKECFAIFLAKQEGDWWMNLTEDIAVVRGGDSLESESLFLSLEEVLKAPGVGKLT